MLKRCLILIVSAVLAAPAFAGGWGGRYHPGWSHGWGGHYGGYHGVRVGGHYSHRGGDEGAALLAGLVIGGLVGWMINEDRHYYDRRPYWREPYPRYRHYEPPRHRYYGRAPRHERVYVHVAPARTAATAPADPEFPGRNCRMTREYTTTIEIDGEARDAYGTKCLSADGGWVLGPAKLAPSFSDE